MNNYLKILAVIVFFIGAVCVMKTYSDTCESKGGHISRTLYGTYECAKTVN